jgi:hypothetical protein
VWVKAVVHLVRLVTTDGQQISQADWQQLKESLMYLAQQQHHQLQGEIDGLFPSCLVNSKAIHVARAEFVLYSTVQLYVSHAFDAWVQL